MYLLPARAVMGSPAAANLVAAMVQLECSKYLAKTFVGNALLNFWAFRVCQAWSWKRPYVFLIPRLGEDMPMQSRDEAIKAIDVGDVIFGIAAGGQEKLLLVYRADSESFSARHVTTQMSFRFGRNGKTKTYADGGYVTIVSTAILPRDAYETVIGLDRKMAAGKAHPDFVLSETEIRMLLTHKDFFAAHPLPE